MCIIHLSSPCMASLVDKKSSSVTTIINKLKKQSIYNLNIYLFQVYVCILFVVPVLEQIVKLINRA
jgi:hypothetical protein